MQQNTSSFFIKIIIACVALALIVCAILFLDVGRSVEVTDFDSCVAAGNLVMESYPEKCQMADGTVYTRVVPEPGPNDMITVIEPVSGALVSSPLTVRGAARGNWYFEASFPIEVLDETGDVIASGHAEAQGDWMTDQFVPFTASISFSTTTASTTVRSGTIRLRNDNPSGLPENEKHVDIPVIFSK